MCVCVCVYVIMLHAPWLLVVLPNKRLVTVLCIHGNQPLNSACLVWLHLYMLAGSYESKLLPSNRNPLTLTADELC